MTIKQCLIISAVITLNYKLETLNSLAQPSYLPLNRDIHNTYEGIFNNKDQSFHTSIKPYLVSEVKNYIDLDSIHDLYKAHSFLARKLGDKYFAKVGKGRTHVDASLLFSLQPGLDLSNLPTGKAGFGKVLETSIGAIVNGDIGKNISFSVNFLSGNSGFVYYLDSVIKNNDVVPGQGYAHKTSLGYAYNTFEGYISYAPSKYFNIQLGQGKNFWGDGYRSLLLSDNSYSYPFLKISTNVWKLKYINLFTIFQDIHNQIPISTWTGIRGEVKYGSFHYLSWNITKRLNIGLFESIIWQGKDSSGVRGYDVNYLNPIIFYRPVEFSLGSADNALLGLNVKLKIAKKQQFYGQIILDEFLLREVKARNGWWANKQGFQVGFKSFDMFRFENLSFQTEFNYVRPYTYSHGNSLQNYAHFNQPLAHPLGANFYESVSFLQYRFKNWLFEWKFLYAVYGADTSGSNWGGDIFLDYKTPREQEYNNKIAQGIKTTLRYADVRVSYLLLPEMNLRAEVGLSNRIQYASGGKTQRTNFIYIGLRTAISNVYYDM